VKSKTDTKVIILGYSGHSYEIIECLQSCQYKISGYYEIKEMDKDPFQLKYLGNESDKDLSVDYNYFICIGDNHKRKSISEEIVKRNLNQINVIHKDACVSNNVKYGYGNFISKNASINSNTEIENNIIINTSSVIEHDCKINSYSHVGPGAIICGGVTVGEGTLIGANSVVNQNVSIGKLGQALLL
jgi:sugar O-acyltransferase (sialic acid O-acetyltransferase NeuD family)